MQRVARITEIKAGVLKSNRVPGVARPGMRGLSSRFRLGRSRSNDSRPRQHCGHPSAH